MDRREGTSDYKPEPKHAAEGSGMMGLHSAVSTFSALSPWAISPDSHLVISREFADFN